MDVATKNKRNGKSVPVRGRIQPQRDRVTGSRGTRTPQFKKPISKTTADATNSTTSSSKSDAVLMGEEAMRFVALVKSKKTIEISPEMRARLQAYRALAD